MAWWVSDKEAFKDDAQLLMTMATNRFYFVKKAFFVSCF